MKLIALLPYSCCAFLAQKLVVKRFFSFAPRSSTMPWDGPLGHLALSKHLWASVIKPGDTVIDATSGNGKDGLHLASLVFEGDVYSTGRLYCIDIQETAIQSTERTFLESEVYSSKIKSGQVKLVCGSHATFPSEIVPESVAAIVYNLGYLPSDPNFKSRPAVEIKEVNNPQFDTSERVQTQPSSTLQSIQSALPLIKPGGLISITAYPLHKGGAEETHQVQSLMSSLDDKVWRVYSHQSLNRPLSPVLFNAFKLEKTKKRSTVE